VTEIQNERPWKIGYRVVAAAVFLFTLSIYTITLNSSVPFWDAGEFIATSYVLGIPHPPGTPLYVLIGRIFSMVPFGTPVFMVNWLSAFASALAMLFTFLLTVAYMRRCQERTRTGADEIIAWTAGVCAALFAAFSNTFWESAVEAEVYALSSWMQVFILWLGLKWWEGLDRGEGDNRLLVAMYLCFLTVGIHLGTFLVLPALVLLVLMVNWRTLITPRNMAWVAVLAVVGLSVHLYLYIRAKANPPINEGDPETWESLRALLMREQYGSRPIFPRQASWSFQFGMYSRYFAEQFVLSARLGPLAWGLPLAFGLFGAVSHFVRNRKTWVIQAVTFLIMSLGLLVYLNFTDHEVRERDYFYTSSFHFFAIWIGMGLAFLVEWARESIPAMRQRAVLVGACAVVVLISLLPMFHHWFKHDHRGLYVARDYSYNMLKPLEPNAFVFTNGDNDTFPLWYVQEVEGVRKDVRVINLSLLNTDWYVKQLRDEEPRVPMNVTDADLERIRDYGYFEDLENRRLVMVSDWMVQNILEANREAKRPAYLAVTVPNHHGLDDRMVLEALVYRILDEPPVVTDEIVRTRNNYMDVPMVKKRLYEDFVYESLFDEDGNFLEKPYKNENARRLSQNYAAAHIQLAYHYRRLGDYQSARAEFERVLRMFPDFGAVRAQLGAFLLESGDTTAAMEYFAIQSVEHPNADLLYYYGMALGITGQTDSAVVKLEAAVRLDPSDPQPHLDAFRFLGEQGRFEEAKEQLEKVLAIDPLNQQARSYLTALDTLGRQSWSGRQSPSGTPPPRPGNR
jgi:tetratricopeptide (TPR) repeat protein